MTLEQGFKALFSQKPADPNNLFAPEAAFSFVKYLPYQGRPDYRWMGLHMTIYGSMRIVAGYSTIPDQLWLNLCAGPDETNIETLYNVVHELLARGTEFRQFPIQDIKPIFRCPRFMQELEQLYGAPLPREDFKIELPPISAVRIHQAKLIHKLSFPNIPV